LPKRGNEKIMENGLTPNQFP